MKTQSKNTPSGFTLIELLVAMAITTIIVTILISITSLSLDAFNRNRAEVRAARQGKAMVDSIATDLESMVIRSGNNFDWLYAKAEALDGDLNGVASPTAVNLVFFSAVTDRYNGDLGGTGDLGGDVSTLAYQLAFQDPLDGSNSQEFSTFALYRKLINPDVTFSDTLGIVGTDGGTELLTSAQDAVNTDSETGNTASEITDTSNFICENIYQFSLTFHVDVEIESNGSPLTVSIPIPVKQGSSGGSSDLFKVSGGGITIDSNFSSSLASEEEIEAGRLTAVEVSLTVLSDFGVEQMRKRSFADDTTLDEFIAENTYQYSKVVLVPGN